MHGNAKILRRTLVWMFVAVFALAGAFAFEHDSSAKGVLLDNAALAKNDGSCDGGNKPNCQSCPDKPDKNCKIDPCQKGNGDEKKNCVPCPESTNHNGEPKKCKPCKTDENGDPQINPHNGNHKPKHCAFSGEEFGQHP